MQVTITGGAGFIGSHTADRFARDGARIVVLDNLSSGVLANLQPAWRLLVGDVRDKAVVQDAVAGADVVVHCAAFTSVPESFGRFDECFAVNVDGTYSVVEAAARAGCGKVVFASSSAVYAAEPDAPKSETDCPGPPSPYGISKLEGEHVLRVLASGAGMGWTAFRFFNVYGPRQAANAAYAAVVPIFIERSLHGQPLVVYGDGRQTRDFVYVSDVAEAIVRAARSEVTGVFNLGTGRPTDVLSVADAVEALSPVPPPRVFEPPRPGDVRSSTAEIARAERLLGWAPAVPLAEGLTATYAWYRRSLATSTSA